MAMVQLAKALIVLGLTFGLTSGMVCDGAGSCMEKQEVTSLLQVKEVVNRRSSPAEPATEADDDEMKLSKLCIREDVTKEDEKQALVLKYVDEILAPHLFEAVDTKKYSQKKGRLDSEEFLDPRTCPYMVGYQHGQMSYFGLPTIELAPVKQHSNLPKTDPEEIIIKLIAKRNEEDQMVYLAQCSEFKEYAKSKKDNWESSGGRPDRKKPHKEEYISAAVKRLDVWSKKCDSDTKVSLVFVTPGFLSWSAYADKDETNTATHYKPKTSYDAEHGVGIGYMVSLLQKLGEGKTPLEAAEYVNEHVIKPRVVAKIEGMEKGVEVLCRQPLLSGDMYKSAAEAMEKDDKDANPAHWNLLVNAAVKSGCIVLHGAGRAKVSSGKTQVDEVAACLKDGTGDIDDKHIVQCTPIGCHHT